MSLTVSTVKQLLERRCADLSETPPKMPNSVAESCTDFLQAFLNEAILRAAAQARAEAEDDSTNSLSSTHLERVLPQLMLDF
jgi:hypothetical protein